jgi:hypothetical protein
MCSRLDAASVVAPSEDRPDALAFSDARLGERAFHVNAG